MCTQAQQRYLSMLIVRLCVSRFQHSQLYACLGVCLCMCVKMSVFVYVRALNSHAIYIQWIIYVCISYSHAEPLNLLFTRFFLFHFISSLSLFLTTAMWKSERFILLLFSFLFHCVIHIVNGILCFFSFKMN